MTVLSPEHRSRSAVLGASCRAHAHAHVGHFGLAAPPATDDGRVRAALTGALAALSPRRRQVLALTVMGGLGPAAIARSLGLSVETVGELLQDGLKLVVSQLAG